MFGQRAAACAVESAGTSRASGLILHGDKGVGKATLAYRIARAYLGATAPGDPTEGDAPFSFSPHDPVFAQIAEGSCPNLYVVEPSKEGASASISVDAIREAVTFFYHTSLNDAPKCVIIDGADAMNRNAQNALLKMLEQPTGSGGFILVCHRLSALLPTIVSRCRKIFLPSPSEIDCMRAMASHAIDNAKEEISTAITLARRSPGRALALLETGAAETYASMRKAAMASLKGDYVAFTEECAGLTKRLRDAATEGKSDALYLIGALVAEFSDPASAPDMPSFLREELWRRHAEAARYAENIYLDLPSVVKNTLAFGFA